MKDQTEQPKITPFSQRTAESIYLEYLNDWLTIGKMAENYNRTELELFSLIEQGRKDHESATETQPEQKPFTPTHRIAVGNLKDEPVIILSRTGYNCKIQAADGEVYFCTALDLAVITSPTEPTKTHLSESQHNSLVSMIFDKLREFEEIGMGEVGECKDEANRIVREWAETNNIELP